MAKTTNTTPALPPTVTVELEPPPATIADAITEAAKGPQSMSSDGQSVSNHRLTDLIEADKYQANKTAARRRGLPIRFVKIRPSGAADVG